MALNDLPTMIRHLSRRLFLPYPMAPRVNMGGKTVIVTGASPGSIGYESAKTLAAWGANVVVTARRNPHLIADSIRQELASIDATAKLDAFPLDVTQPQSVQEFADWFRDTHGNRLDVLLNNAGVHLDLLGDWKSPHLSEDGFELHWRTNFLGPLQLTFALLPLLQRTGRETGDARVIYVASHLHQKAINSELFGATRPYNSWTAYGISKLGLIHCAFEIQRRFAATDHVQGFALHPGSVYTNIASLGLGQHALLKKIRDVLAPVEKRILLTPVQGAQTSILCASQPGLQGGRYFERCAVATPSTETHDNAVAERLWQETLRWAQGLAIKTTTPGEANCHV